MEINKETYININKYPLLAGLIVYVIGAVILPASYPEKAALQPGIIFVLGAGLFNLLNQKYFVGRLKLAAHIWLIPLIVGCFSYSIPIQQGDYDYNMPLWLINTIISGIPFLLLFFGKAKQSPSKKARLKIVSARIIVQCLTFMIYAAVSAGALIHLNHKIDLIYWAIFHITTTAIFPFLFGRVLCGWICPNSTLQDGLIKNLNFRRPISSLPKAIEEQTNSCSMNISGEVDKTAPMLPATLLLCWFPMFFCETVFDLVPKLWYPVGFMYGLFVLSFILPWRKVCAHFCWLSSYRALGGHGSLWRIRFNKSKCQECKKCLPEEVCPFFINIREQDNEMPASCCLCFSCMEACPFDGVITFRRGEEEKARLKAA